MCDGCADIAWCDGDNAVEAAKFARSIGWQTRKKHLCPRCRHLTPNELDVLSCGHLIKGKIIAPHNSIICGVCGETTKRK